MSPNETITVTKTFLDALLQRGVEKGSKEGYQEGFLAGKQAASKESKKAEAEAHELGVTNGLLWGLNCPQSFRIYWEQTGRLQLSMPTSVMTLKSATSHLTNFNISHLVEADSKRHLSPSHPANPPPSINLLEASLPPASSSPTNKSHMSANYHHDPLLAFFEDSPPLRWSEESPERSVSPQPPPRDFSDLRTSPQDKSSAWGNLQRRKRRVPAKPRQSQAFPKVFSVSSLHQFHSKIPNLGQGSWVFLPSGLRSVIVQGDEDAAIFCGG